MRMEQELITLCLFDVLGISERIRKGQLQEVYTLYSDLVDITSSLKGRMCLGVEPMTDGTGIPVMFTQNIYNAYFSDTFLIWTNAAMVRMSPFINTCMNIFSRSLELAVPLRGCIATGQAVMDTERGIFIGQPIVEAARGESAQKWLGFAFGPSFLDAPCFDCKMFLPYTSHMKDGFGSLLSPFVIDWPRYWRESKKESAHDALQRMNTEPSFSVYYENTIAFADFSDGHHEWWREARIDQAHSPGELAEVSQEWVQNLH
jgi:hypothetical protein